jgi:hypothetical protein
MKLKENLLPENPNELINFILLNAIRRLDSEQIITLTKSLIERIPKRLKKSLIKEFSTTHDYDFSFIEKYIVSSYFISECFSFDIYADLAPDEGDIVLLNGNLYEVKSVCDNTSKQEREDGFSYSRIILTKL